MKPQLCLRECEGLVWQLCPHLSILEMVMTSSSYFGCLGSGGLQGIGVLNLIGEAL